jgi:alkylation response protein AidB-like acyl-CoA dehydrogenase
MNTTTDVAPGTDWNALSDEDFRHRIRSYLEANYPGELRYPSRRLFWTEIGSWYRKMSEIGWIAPNWPREHGGMGLNPGKLLIFYEEHERWGVSRFADMGILMVGPLLIRHGTPEQRQQWLPRIIACEHLWCQGYSEPNAGSDLAGLRTEAVRDGDEYVINGQKIWTTLAQDATHIFILARTDKEAKKQAGISFFLADMSQPGIRVRPIRDVAGHEELNEVFLENVRVPAENLVGVPNEGWSIAKALLGFERIFLGAPKYPNYALGVLARVAQACGLMDEPGFAFQFAKLRMHVEDHTACYERFIEIVKRGEPVPPDISMLKVVSTESFQAIADQVIRAAGQAGQLVGPVALGEDSIDVLGPFFRALPSTIYGGTNEIQRNVLAREVLRLPS